MTTPRRGQSRSEEPRRSSATPPTRRATCSSASCARRSAPPTSIPAPPAARAERLSSASPIPASPPASATSTTPTSSSSSAPTPCTAPRSSTCASARRSAATAPRWPSPPTAPRPSTAAPEATTRYAPGGATLFLSQLAACLRVGTESEASEIATVLRNAESVAILWGERIGREGEGALRALLDVASALNLSATEGSGLLESPGANQRPRPARSRLPPGRRAGLRRKQQQARTPSRSAPPSNRAS